MGRPHRRRADADDRDVSNAERQHEHPEADEERQSEAVSPDTGIVVLAVGLTLLAVIAVGDRYFG